MLLSKHLMQNQIFPPWDAHKIGIPTTLPHTEVPLTLLLETNGFKFLVGEFLFLGLLVFSRQCWPLAPGVPSFFPTSSVQGTSIKRKKNVATVSCPWLLVRTPGSETKRETEHHPPRSLATWPQPTAPKGFPTNRLLVTGGQSRIWSRSGLGIEYLKFKGQGKERRVEREKAGTQAEVVSRPLGAEGAGGVGAGTREEPVRQMVSMSCWNGQKVPPNRKAEGEPFNTITQGPRPQVSCPRRPVHKALQGLAPLKPTRKSNSRCSFNPYPPMIP